MKKIVLSFILLMAVISPLVFMQNVYAYTPEDIDLAYHFASEKLEQEKLSYEFIDGLGEENRYVVFEGKEVGYLVFDIELGIYIEFSKEDKSPFEKVKGEKIYVGPTYYYEQDGKDLKDVRSGIKLSKKEKEALYKFKDKMTKTMKNDLKAYKDNLYEEEVESQMLDAQFYEQSAVTAPSSSPSETNAVPYSFYFENLRENMGENVDGTCTFIASGMILSYYDSVYDDDIVPEQFDVSGTRRVSDEPAANIDPFSSWSDITATEFNQSPGVTEAFHVQTIDDMDTGNSMGIGEVNTLISNYLDDADISYTTHQWSILNLFTSRLQWVRNGIDSGNPVYVHFTGTDTALDSRDLNHAVVGYEYDENGIFVNFGWKGRYSHVNISNYSIQNVLYFELDDTESTIYNYEWDSTNGASGRMSIGGNVNCFHNIEVLSVNDTSHLLGCGFCGNDCYYFNHDFDQGTCTVCNHDHVNHTLSSTWYGTATSHYRKCSTCDLNVYCSEAASVTSYTDTTHTYTCSEGYSRTYNHTFDSNNDCTACGYHAEHIHSYTHNYLPSLDNKHRAFCACGAYVLRPHIGVAPDNPFDPMYCYFCGAVMNGGIVMLSTPAIVEYNKYEVI